MKRNKMSLFADEIIEYVKKSKIKLFVLINKTIKVTGYKINLENHFNPVVYQETIRNCFVFN